MSARELYLVGSKQQAFSAVVPLLGNLLIQGEVSLISFEFTKVL